MEFKNLISNVDKVKPGTSKVKLEWFYDKLKKEDIALKPDGSYAIKPSCGCTANVVVTDESIKAFYSDNTYLSEGEKSKTVSKYLTVYLKDELPVFVKNPVGTTIYNVNKSKIILTFNVKIEK